MLLRIDNLSVPEATPFYLSPNVEPREVKNKGQVFDGVLATFGHDGDIPAGCTCKAMSKLHCALRVVTSKTYEDSDPITYLVLSDMKRYGIFAYSALTCNVYIFSPCVIGSRPCIFLF